MGSSAAPAPKAAPTPAGPNLPAYSGIPTGTPAAPVTAPATTNPSIFDQSAAWMTQAGQMAQPGTIASGMDAYQNPYQQQVIDNTTRQMQEAYQMADMGLGDQAQSASAFGGARHGLAQGQLAGDFTQNVGDMASQLNMQGFNTAAALSGQDIANQMRGGTQLGSLAGQGFDMGRTLNQDQYRMGADAQALQQAIMNNAQQMYGGMTPLGALGALQGLVGGSPLMGNTWGRNVADASGAQKLGTALSIIPGMPK